MRDEFISFSPPLIGDEEINEVIDTLKSNWITTGPKTKRFEKEFANYFNAPCALALNSCTASLHLALAANNIGEGDEVITTPMTFSATVNVIEHVGATPVLVDIEPDTLNIDAKKIEASITKKTKAIMVVHYAGHPVDLDSVFEIAKQKKIEVIEDAAHAVSAKYKGKYIGSGDNPVAFSFYATKNLTTAEGGMLTGNSDFIEKARILSLHGMNKDAWKRYDKAGSWYYEIVSPGFKYNMTDIQSSIGIWQLKKLSDFQKKREKIVEAYNSAFKGVNEIELPVKKGDIKHSWHLYVIKLNLDTLTIDRDIFINELTTRNIGASVHFIPIHIHPYYKNKYKFKAEDFPVALENFKKIISLPLNAALTDNEVNYIIEAVLDIIQIYKK
ncbi:MAG: DegT/DnrJ/EryC1/StrS aminotransferase family protein [Desulfobacterales bacterium]|nr:DegT/DnrJ/EryC1/StrS aminotransferase family protein [Desulfobacterales bacterium]